MIYVVRLFEVLMDEITINASTNITWPKLIEERKISSLDGVLILYDVTDEESVIEVPDVLCESGLTCASHATTCERSISTDVLTRCQTSCRFP